MVQDQGRVANVGRAGLDPALMDQQPVKQDAEATVGGAGATTAGTWP